MFMGSHCDPSLDNGDYLIRPSPRDPETENEGNENNNERKIVRSLPL